MLKLPNIIQRFIVVASVVSVIGSSPTDVWVSVGNQLVTPVNQLSVPGAKYLTGLHGYYEDGQLVLLATDIGQDGATLYKIQGQNTTQIYQDASTTYFEGVVYSPSSRSIYLTSPSTHSILRISEDGEVRTVFHDPKKIPSGLAIHPCTSTVYWTNTARGGATIEAWQESNQDTIQSRVLVSEGLVRPRGISVDLHTRSLYWTDQERSKFGVWRSGLSGEGRTKVAGGVGGEPFGLAVDEGWIYWTDWSRHAEWRIHKLDTNRKAELVREFKGSKPNGIAYIPNPPISCQTDNAKEDASTEISETSSEISQTSTEIGEVEFGTEIPVHPAYKDTFSIQEDQPPLNCSNTILCVKGVVEDGECVCEEGWTGQYCEVSVCYNFCVRGECRVVEGNPLCLCSTDFAGDRCEISEGCSLSVVGGITSNYLIIILPVVCSFQLIIILALSAAFYRYTKKPRIVRKRFISVSKPKEKKKEVGCGVQLPTEDGIQLDIENCCNMTMCDTPCFEPPSRVPKDIYSPKKSSSKTSNILRFYSRNEKDIFSV